MILPRNIIGLVIVTSIACSMPLFGQMSDSNEEELIRRIKDSNLNWILGARLQVTNPQREFRDSLIKLGGPDVGIGIDINAGYYFDPIPVAVTLEGGILFMGGESTTKHIRSGLFRDTIQVSSSTIIVPVNTAVRFMPSVGRWLFPYIEGIVGFNVHASSFSLTQDRMSDSRSQSDSRSDVAFTYGLGAGLAVRVADIVTFPASLQRVLLDVRMRYLFGGAVDVSKVDVVVDETNPLNSTYAFRSASVSMSDQVFFSVGVAVQF